MREEYRNKEQDHNKIYSWADPRYWPRDMGWHFLFCVLVIIIVTILPFVMLLLSGWRG